VDASDAAAVLALRRGEDGEKAAKLMRVHRTFTCAADPSATLQGMTTSPREFGITTLLFSIYVSARGGAQVAGAARRLLR
jgi:hypothetical protein